MTGVKTETGVHIREDRQQTNLKLGCDGEDEFIGAWLQRKTGLWSDNE